MLILKEDHLHIWPFFLHQTVRGTVGGWTQQPVSGFWNGEKSVGLCEWVAVVHFGGERSHLHYA